MGYLHIDNLYKNRAVLEFSRVYALEKIHGTSAHIRFDGASISFFAGGAKHERFVELFDPNDLAKRVLQFASPVAEVIVYGEAYGGKLQGMSDTYGPDMKFVVFDIKINDRWCDVPTAASYTELLGLEFVEYAFVAPDTEILDAMRDAPSPQARRNGFSGDAEGIVLRPPFECFDVYGNRIIAKYKREKFRETKAPRNLTDAELKVLSDAQEVAEEWVTEMRLTHVLDKLGNVTIQDTGNVIKAFTNDVLREAAGEIVESKEVLRAIRQRAGELFRSRVTRLEQ